MPWLLVRSGVAVIALVAVWRIFVGTRTGQQLDTVALTGNQIGQARIGHAVLTVLDAVTGLAGAAVLIVAFLALVRRRPAVLGAAAVLIAGASGTTELLKRAIARPELGVDEQRAAAGNSLPSGHTTLAASVVVALLLALPAGLAAVGALFAAVCAAAVGIGTLSVGWHRPSDAVAGLLVVGVWAGLAELVLVLADRPPDAGWVRHRATGPSWMALALAAAGLVLLVGAVLALHRTDQVLATPPDELSRRQLWIAYAGGAMGIAGTSGLLLASVLASLRYVATRPG